MNVKSPKLVLSPSAIDIGGYWSCIFFFFNESSASLAKYGYTPIALQPFPKYFVDKIDPLANPPPPIGKTK